MQLGNKDTLSYQMSVGPAALKLDMTQVKVKDAVKLAEKYKKANSEVKPESEAFKFYLANHAVANTQQRRDELEPLDDELDIVQDYQKYISDSGMRMFSYLLYICTRESRHVYDNYHWEKAKKEYGIPAVEFVKGIRGTGSSGAVAKLVKNPPSSTLGEYTNLLEDVFFKGKFSGGYGGPAWGEIARVLRKYVHGEFSTEMMMDTAFTLCHNNGPIFNKGMFFSHYSSSSIMTILDVQRSGQIPQLIADGNFDQYIDIPLREFYNRTCKFNPEFSGYVDWYLVEGLGAMQSYGHQKSVQVQKHGIPESQKKIEAMQKAEEAKKAAEQAELAKHSYQVDATLTVKKFERS